MMKRYSLIGAAKMVTLFALSSTGLVYSSVVLSQATVRDSSPISSKAAVIGNSAIASGVGEVDTAASSSSNIRGDGVSTPAVSAPPPVSSPNTAYQIQQLQQEISELRGLLEEQAFQLKRLKKQRLDDYLDLDKRLGELSTANTKNNPIAKQVLGASSPTIASNVKPTESSVANLAGRLPTATPNNSEEGKKLYRKAIDQLLNQQDYSAAQNSFSSYLRKYPDGVYKPNVYYWQGQIYLTESNKSAAEKAFKNLVDQYKDHQKTPDAKYKLATIYFDQGKKDKAKQLLNEVVASDTDASRLAKSFLVSQY